MVVEINGRMIVWLAGGLSGGRGCDGTGGGIRGRARECDRKGGRERRERTCKKATIGAGTTSLEKEKRRVRKRGKKIFSKGRRKEDASGIQS